MENLLDKFGYLPNFGGFELSLGSKKKNLKVSNVSDEHKKRVDISDRMKEYKKRVDLSDRMIEVYRNR